MNTQLNIIEKLRSKMVGFFAVCMVMGLALSLTPSVSMAQSGTPVEQTIKNQAEATYDINGQTLTTTSNEVKTTVQRVRSVTITAGNDQTVNPGEFVSFTHTITNNGNSDDNFDITASNATNSGAFNNVRIHEIGGNTSFNSNETGTLSPGQSIQVVVRADAKGTASGGESDKINVTATSQNDQNITASANPKDKAIISKGAVVNLSKKLSHDGTTGTSISGGLSNSQNPGNGKVTVSIEYTNNGTKDASSLEITDDLSANGFTYVGNPKVDGSDVSSDVNVTAAGKVTYTASNDLQVNDSKTLTFDVKAKEADNSYGTTITNTAVDDYDTGVGSETGSNSSDATYDIEANYSVEVNSGTNGTITKGPFSEKTTHDFVNKFTNTGNVKDTYNVQITSSDYTGTDGTVTLYRANGNDVLDDTDGDGIDDTGLIQPGETVEVVVRVTLPPGEKTNGYSLTKKATSVNKPGESSVTATDVVNEVTGASVDITNDVKLNNATNQGEGVEPTGESSAVTTNDADAGSTTEFTLYINNKSGPAQDYDLKAGKNGSLDDLPSEWTVDFQDGSGNSLGNNTGNIAEEGEMKVIAVVSVPAGADYNPNSDQDIFFRAKSGSEVDVKHDAVHVKATRSFTLEDNESNTVDAGESVTYAHTLTNSGNVEENEGTNSTLELTLNDDKSDFSSKVYYDTNSNGTLEPGTDILITTSSTGAGELKDGSNSLIAFNSGDTIPLVVKVKADNGVSDGTTNTTTLTVGDDGSGQSVDSNNNSVPVPANVSVTDETSVQAGSLDITKTQRIKGSSNSYSQDPITDANPGDVIEYKVTVENTGTSTVSTVNVTDEIPDYTKLEDAVAKSGDGSPSIDSNLTTGDTGTVEVSVGSLDGGKSFNFTFSVKIDEN